MEARTDTFGIPTEGRQRHTSDRYAEENKRTREHQSNSW